MEQRTGRTDGGAESWTRQPPPRQNPMPVYKRPVAGEGYRPQRPVGYEQRQALAEEGICLPTKTARHAPVRAAGQGYTAEMSVEALHQTARHGADKLAGEGYPMPRTPESRYRTAPMPAAARGHMAGHGTGHTQAVNEEDEKAWRGYSVSGTASAPADPFDEPGEDPSLRSDRSDKLYTRDDPFWQHPLGSAPAQTPVKAKQGGHVLRNVLVLAVVLLAVGLLLRGTVFRVRSIRVEGNSSITDAEIIRLSGIEEGANIFSLNADQVSAGVASSRYLEFVRLETELPDSVILYVRERRPAAVMSYCGINYVLDMNGMVLEESETDDEDMAALVQVRGFSVTDCAAGRRLGVSKAAQLSLFSEYMVELRVQSLLGEITELNVSDLDNIYLVTARGFSVRMGGSTDVHAKLRSLMLTQSRLTEMGYEKGTIDVSYPVNPTFIPEEQWTAPTTGS